MTPLENIRAAMANIANLPCGGVGADGATRKALHDSLRQSRDFAFDYYQAQSAWLYLRDAEKQLVEQEKGK